jgi:hypothetical protein
VWICVEIQHRICFPGKAFSSSRHAQGQRNSAAVALDGASQALRGPLQALEAPLTPRMPNERINRAVMKESGATPTRFVGVRLNESSDFGQMKPRAPIDVGNGNFPLFYHLVESRLGLGQSLGRVVAGKECHAIESFFQFKFIVVNPLENFIELAFKGVNESIQTLFDGARTIIPRRSLRRLPRLTSGALPCHDNWLCPEVGKSPNAFSPSVAVCKRELARLLFGFPRNSLIFRGSK